MQKSINICIDGKAIMNSKSHMSDQDFINLIEQYSRHFYQIFKGKGYFVWFDEIKGRLTEICFEARNNYRSNRNNTASMRTYIISAFRKRMINYEKRELKRKQKEHGMETWCFINPETLMKKFKAVRR